MKTQLHPQQIEQYQRDGFTYVPSFLSGEEVAALKEAVLSTAQGMGKKKVAGGGADLVEGESYYDNVFTQRLNLWRVSDIVKRYMLSLDLGKLLCQLEDVNGMRVWHDQTLIKEPFANPTAWHLDNPYWSFSSRHALSLWIALEDATLHNGCMWFVPGTHKMASYRGVDIGHNMGALFEVYPEMATVDPVPVPMKAGDCSFHNGLAAHGAGANMTRTRRIAMTCAYMPVGSTFNGKQNILPDDYFHSLKEGQVLENDDWNPVVFSK